MTGGGKSTMKKNYQNPELSVMLTCEDDIMLLSDTFVDVGELWGTDEPTETPAE